MASVIPEEGNSRPLSRGGRHLACAGAAHGALQLGLYFIVGGILFCIDVGGFVAPRSLKLPILAASALSLRNSWSSSRRSLRSLPCYQCSPGTISGDARWFST
jgi:hypothetical protein